MMVGVAEGPPQDPSNVPDITCTALPTQPTGDNLLWLFTYHTQTLPVAILQGEDPPAFGISVPTASPVVPEV